MVVIYGRKKILFFKYQKSGVSDMIKGRRTRSHPNQLNRFDFVNVFYAIPLYFDLDIDFIVVFYGGCVAQCFFF